VVEATAGATTEATTGATTEATAAAATEAQRTRRQTQSIRRAPIRQRGSECTSPSCKDKTPGTPGYLRVLPSSERGAPRVAYTLAMDGARSAAAAAAALALLTLGLHAAGCEPPPPRWKVPDDAALPPCAPATVPRAAVATHYPADGTGACSFEAVPAPVMVAAIARASWDQARWCGACAEVIGPKGIAVVRIVDSCPSCPADALDLSREAFSRIAPLRAGRVAVTWRAVACPVEGPLRFRIKDGSNAQWLGIQVRNHRYPIQTMESQRGDGAWAGLERKTYNYFVGVGLGPGPHRLRITDQRGQQLVELVARSAEPVPEHPAEHPAEQPAEHPAEHPGRAQFPRCPE
jgi:expansin